MGDVAYGSFWSYPDLGMIIFRDSSTGTFLVSRVTVGTIDMMLSPVGSAPSHFAAHRLATMMARTASV